MGQVRLDSSNIAASNAASCSYPFCPLTTWTATVKKERRHASLGIELEGEGTRSSPVIISNIQPNSLFARQTRLCAGLRVISINGVCVAEGWSAKELEYEIRNARMERPLTLVAQGVVAEYDCSSNNAATLGVQFYKSPLLENNAIMIGSIAPYSAFAKSGLQVGYRVTVIDGEVCPLTPQEVSDKLTTSMLQQQQLQKETDVTTNKKRPKLVAIDTYIGSPILIDRIREARIPNTPSEEDYYISCPTNRLLRKTAARVVTMHANVAGSSFGDDYDNSNNLLGDCLIISARKPYQFGLVGLGLQKDEATSLVFVQSISTRSIFYETSLQVGQCIVTVNGLQCPSDTTAAVKMIRDIESDVWLEVGFPSASAHLVLQTATANPSRNDIPNERVVVQ